MELRGAFSVSIVLSLVFGCTAPRWTSAPVNELPAGAEVRSLAGEVLYPPPLADDVKATREAELAAAERELEGDPGDPAKWVAVGRRLSNLGRYREAVGTYGRALGRFGDEVHLLRHRGHRWITLREPELAVRDLERAAELSLAIADEPEPSLNPNSRGVVTDTLKQNIYYHLALAQYLLGDFASSLSSWRECARWSTNPDTVCAAVHWQAMTLAKLGRFDEIEKLAAPITADLDVVDYHAYHRLCLMYKGEISPEFLLASAAPTGPTAVDFATQGYGVGNWLACRGETERARAIFERVAAVEIWAAFGRIASEYELAR
ncbi:MAG: tetratricopeptide repeat protein [Planctomycetes bacterium]|nr:tetratricopeptide repeat protein [Planctomycetota bacterium]